MKRPLSFFFVTRYKSQEINPILHSKDSLGSKRYSPIHEVVKQEACLYEGRVARKCKVKPLCPTHREQTLRILVFIKTKT